MKTIFILLVLGVAAVHSSFGQTLKNLTYNASNGQVIANTGSNVLTFTNPLQFATNSRATTRTNLGLGASWLINTNNPVFVNTNGTLAAPTNFFTANLPIWATSTNPASAASSLGQTLSAPSYLRTSSRDTSSNNAGGIVSAISFDGINWEATRNHTIFPVFSRDASTIWYSNKWVSIYTDAFGSTNKTFGIATSTDLLSWQTNFSVTLTGTNTAGTGNNVWAPEWFVDGTNYYALVRLSTTAGNNYGAPGVGWMRALNPGTWTSWSDWTPFDSTVRVDANDFYIVKKDSLYWLFSHGGTHLGGKQPAGSNVVNNITLQYSTNPFGNYSPLVEITEPLRAIIRPGNSSAFFEGPSVVNVEGSRWRLFFQDGLDNTAWAIDSYDDFATWNTNSLRRLQYSGFDGSGHGTVVGINATNQQGIRQAVLALGTGPTIGGAWLTNTNVTNFRTAIGLGSAATNDASAFQPSSANLTNLASNNAINLTNFPALLLRTNGSAAGLTSFPTLNQNTTGTASNVTGVVAITNGGTGTNTAGGARTNLELGITNSVTFSNITANGTLGVSNTAAFATNVSVAGNLTVKSLVTSDPVNIILDATQTSAATNGVLTLPDNANLIRLTNNNAISAVTNGRLGSFYYLVNQATNAVILSNVGGITIDGATNFTLAPNESATLVALGPTNISVANRGGLETNNNVTFSNITATGTLAVTGNATLSGTDNLAPSQTNTSSAHLMTRDLVRVEMASPRSLDAIYWFGLQGQGSVWSAVGSGAVLTMASRHTTLERGFALGLALRASSRIGTNVTGAGIRLAANSITGDGPYRPSATGGNWQMETQICTQLFINSTNSIAFIMSGPAAGSMWDSTNTVGLYYVPAPTNSWVSSATVTQHDRIAVSNVVWSVNTAGTNGATAPTWTDLIGSLVTNGSAVYINAGPHTSNNWSLVLGHTNASQVVMSNTGKTRFGANLDVRLYVRYATNDNRWYASVEDNNGRSSEVSLTNVGTSPRTPQFWTRYDSTNTVAGDQVILLRYLSVRSQVPAL
jgi:hypothetical protein